jgi:hypothetical protein
VLDTQSGKATFGSRVLTDGLTVNVSFTSSTTYPSDPLDDACADVPNGAVQSVGIVLEGGRLQENLDDSLGSLKLASPTAFACTSVNGQRVDTISYSGPAVYQSFIDAKSGTGPAAVFAALTVGDSSGPATAVARVTGQPITIK